MAVEDSAAVFKHVVNATLGFETKLFFDLYHVSEISQNRVVNILESGHFHIRADQFVGRKLEKSTLRIISAQFIANAAFGGNYHIFIAALAVINDLGCRADKIA